jgi:hypothetical protein
MIFIHEICREWRNIPSIITEKPTPNAFVGFIAYKYLRKTTDFRPQMKWTRIERGSRMTA